MAYLSRIAVDFLAPLNILFALLVLSLCSLLLKRIRVGVVFLLLGLGVLVIAGYGFGTRDFIEQQEYAYLPLSDEKIEALDKESIQYVVVLGSGHVSDPRLVATSQIGGASLYRLVEGIRIHQLIPSSRLVILGGAVYDPVPNARVVSTVARHLGVLDARMIVEESPQNTMQEAELTTDIVGSHEFILVTSAMHMERALEIFEDKGLSPIAAPTDYIIKNKGTRHPGRYLPNPGNFELSKTIIYEWVGTRWMEIKQFIENYL